MSSSNATAALSSGNELQTSFYERQSAGPVRNDSQQSMHAAVERNVAARQARRPTAPRFVSAPQGRIAEQGEDAYLDAIVDSHPPSEIVWTKNGVELVPDGRKISISGGPNKSRLDIAQLTVEDSGQYTCRASNAAGATSCTTDVIVKSTSDASCNWRFSVRNCGSGGSLILFWAGPNVFQSNIKCVWILRTVLKTHNK